MIVSLNYILSFRKKYGKNNGVSSKSSKTSKKPEPVVEDKVDDEVEAEELDDDDDDEEEVEEVEEADEDDKKKKKLEYVCESVESLQSELKRIDTEVLLLLKWRGVVSKSGDKFTNKLLKQQKKRRSTVSDVPKEPNGFIKAKSVPPKFKEFYEKHLKSDADFLAHEELSKLDFNQDQARTPNHRK